MSSFVVTGNASGSGTHTLQSANTSSNVTQTLPLTDATTLGYVNAPVNEQSTAYSTVASDAGKIILHPTSDANARVFTIDASVTYDLGTVLTFINLTSQVVTISLSSGTIYQAGTGSTGSRSLAQYGIATAVKMTSTTWLISGNGLT